MRNVLLITVDSLRADHVGCYGYDRETTPNLDSIAHSAHRFTRAFSHAGATRASFPSILTSTYPLMYGGFEQLAEQRTVVSEPLKAAGYRTGGFHSNPYLSKDFGYSRGFDTFYDSQSDPSVLSRLREWVTKSLDSDGAVFQLLGTAFELAERQTGVELGSPYVKADTLTDNAIQWVDESGPSRNFLWVHYMDAHHPYVPPEEYQRQFRSTGIDDRESVRLRRKMLGRPEAVTDQELQDLVDLYDAEIRFVDSEIERLTEHVSRRWDETDLFVTSDHGEAFREHGVFGHGALYEDGIHVPLVADVGESRGTHDELIGLLDLAPTLLECANVSIPASYEGRSFARLLGEQHSPSETTWSRQTLIGEAGYDDEGRPILYYRDDRWKYIVRDGEEELYDLDADPRERTSVLDRYPDVADQIRATLSDHRQTVAATDTELNAVEMTEGIENRLEALGYREK